MATLLFIANWLVHWLWKRGHDPDNFSIPYLTAVGDLLGGMLLTLTFHLLYVVGDLSVSESGGRAEVTMSAGFNMTSSSSSVVTVEYPGSAGWTYA